MADKSAGKTAPKQEDKSPMVIKDTENSPKDVDENRHPPVNSLIAPPSHGEDNLYVSQEGKMDAVDKPHVDENVMVPLGKNKQDEHPDQVNPDGDDTPKPQKKHASTEDNAAGSGRIGGDAKKSTKASRKNDPEPDKTLNDWPLVDKQELQKAVIEQQRNGPNASGITIEEYRNTKGYSD